MASRNLESYKPLRRYATNTDTTIQLTIKIKLKIKIKMCLQQIRVLTPADMAVSVIDMAQDLVKIFQDELLKKKKGLDYYWVITPTPMVYNAAVAKQVTDWYLAAGWANCRCSPMAGFAPHEKLQLELWGYGPGCTKQRDQLVLTPADMGSASTHDRAYELIGKLQIGLACEPKNQDTYFAYAKPLCIYDSAVRREVCRLYLTAGWSRADCDIIADPADNPIIRLKLYRNKYHDCEEGRTIQMGD